MAGPVPAIHAEPETDIARRTPNLILRRPEGPSRRMGGFYVLIDHYASRPISSSFETRAPRVPQDEEILLLALDLNATNGIN
jgi:hypothetical protein